MSGDWWATGLGKDRTLFQNFEGKISVSAYVGPRMSCSAWVWPGVAEAGVSLGLFGCAGIKGEMHVELARASEWRAHYNLDVWLESRIQFNAKLLRIASFTSPAYVNEGHRTTLVSGMSGRVVDEYGSPISGVQITVQGPSQSEKSVLTNADGFWHVPLVVGSVDITPSLTGYTFLPGSKHVTTGSSGVNFTGTEVAPPELRNPVPASASSDTIPFLVRPGKSYTLKIGASDPLGLPLTAAWSSSQGRFANRKLDSVQWTAPPSGGRVAVVVEVSNGEVSTQHTWHFNVVPYDPPVLGQADPPTSKEAPLAVKPGETCELSIAVSDPAGLPLTSTWSSSRGSLAQKELEKVQWTAPAEAGAASVVVEVSNGHTTAQHTWYFQVGHEDYDAHDYSLLLTFLEQTDGAGVKNGVKLSSNYVPFNPATWDRILWTDEQVKRVHAISIDEKGCAGPLVLEGLTALESLAVSGNQLTEIDVSGCTSLKWLGCWENGLTELDLRGCTSLEILFCGQNSLTALDLSGLSALRELNCAQSSLTQLDLSGCTALEVLRVSSNCLTSLDVSGLSQLREVNCNENALTELNVTGCLSLEFIDCENNQLTSLDVNGLPSLRILVCSNNTLTHLDVAGCTALEELECQWNKLKALDITADCDSLEFLNCSFNQLRSLDVSGLGALNYLSCGNNALAELDVTECGGLETLWCDTNKLTSLNVRGCPSLVTLVCSDNKLSELDVSACGDLQVLICVDNSLEQLDLSSCIWLRELACSDNELEILDLSKLDRLESVSCQRNRLSALLVDRCPSLKEIVCAENQLKHLDVSDCPDLVRLETSGNEGIVVVGWKGQ
jgi:Leucine-rich repeat (LRR) protein